MENKVIIEEYVQIGEKGTTSVIAVINEEPKSMVENSKLYLVEINETTRKIASAVTSARYKLNMKIMSQYEDDFYIKECDRIVNGLSATPIYDSIQEFAAAYKKNSNTIISKLNKSANLNSRPL